MVQWKMANYLKGNDFLLETDTPIFDWNMIMEGKCIDMCFPTQKKVGIFF